MARRKKTEVTVETDSHREKRLDGVVIGVLMGLEGDLPLVVFPGNPKDDAMPARSTVQLSSDDIGAEVALMFEGGDAARPIVMGRLLRPAGKLPAAEPDGQADENRRLEFDAADEIVLRCGKASVTLTKAGKILLRGAYIFSRSTGVNKMKGGSIQLN